MVNIWQLGGGNGRNVVEYYKCMGIACIGPSSIKVGKDDKDWNKLKKIANSSREASALWNFVNELKAEDVIIVKSSRKSFALIGIVHNHDGTKEYTCKEGVSVDGWDLGHQVKVDWYSVKEDKTEKAYDFVFKPDYSIPIIRFSKCDNGLTNEFKQICESSRIREYLGDEKNKFFEFEPPNESKYKELKVDLPIQYLLTPEEMRLSSVKSGNETFTKIFLVVPFLKSMGWIPELMEFEKNTSNGPADIVLYKDLEQNTPFAIVETKRVGNALGSYALKQAKDYAEGMDRQVEIVLATDGYRYVLSRYGEEEIFEIDRYSGKMTDEQSILFLHPSTCPLKEGNT